MRRPGAFFEKLGGGGRAFRGWGSLTFAVPSHLVRRRSVLRPPNDTPPPRTIPSNPPPPPSRDFWRWAVDGTAVGRRWVWAERAGSPALFQRLLGFFIATDLDMGRDFDPFHLTARTI